MVSVMVVRPFRHLDRNVFGGEWIDLEPLDAAVKSHEGLVSLLHGQTYQTRDMVAATPVQAMTIQSFESTSEQTDTISEAPPKRRRGRPRKVRD